eukprot:gene3962-6138_t
MDVEKNEAKWPVPACAEEGSVEGGEGSEASGKDSTEFTEDSAVGEPESFAEARRMARAALDKHRPSDRWATTQSLRGVSCFIPNRLYVGGYFASKKKEVLRDEHGIRCIINCCADESPTDEEACLAFGLKHHSIAARDEPGYPLLDAHFDEFFAVAKAADAAGLPIFVHCLAGVNRS